MDQLQPSPLPSQAENRATITSRIAGALFALLIVIFAVFSMLIIWGHADVEMLLKILVSFLILAFTLTTLAALGGARHQ